MSIVVHQRVGFENPDERTVVPDTGFARAFRCARNKTLSGSEAGSAVKRVTVVLHDGHVSDTADLEHHFSENHLCVCDRVGSAIGVQGSLADLARVFGVEFYEYVHAESGRSFVSHDERDVSLPSDLAKKVSTVLGLSDFPIAKSTRKLVPAASSATHAGAPVAMTPVQVAKAYDFPNNSGSGQCIALIELGGGYRPSDLSAYFAQLGVSPAPQVISVSVDGATNSPTGNPDSADGEVVLDIEVAGAVAHAARIVVYFAPNSDQGFYDAINQAANDVVYKPSIVSISWGGPEDSWSPATMRSFNSLFQSKPNLTVLAAAGDAGSSDGESGKHVDFPASSPYVTACGGTRLLLTPAGNISAETVWNDGAQGGATGGGISSTFATPTYQAGLTAIRSKGRGVPDVSGNADPVSGYKVLVDGQSFSVGGTSAVAPLWAGLVARINSANGKPCGFLNPILYKATHSPFNDVTSGNNGSFSASKGYDCCTGLGTPRGNLVLQTFASTPTSSSSSSPPPASSPVKKNKSSGLLSCLSQS